ncbi:MAG: hypothetical protein ABI423_02020 [Burkholderiales bacterium]
MAAPHAPAGTRIWIVDPELVRALRVFIVAFEKCYPRRSKKVGAAFDALLSQMHAPQAFQIAERVSICRSCIESGVFDIEQLEEQPCATGRLTQ